jgi:hypothetical protein
MGECFGDSARALGRPRIKASNSRTSTAHHHVRGGSPFRSAEGLEILVSHPFPLATHPAPAPHLLHIGAPRSNVVEFPPHWSLSPLASS